MNRSDKSWAMALVVAASTAALARTGSTGAEPEPAPDAAGQVLIECRFVELPARTAQAFFGAEGLAPGVTEVTDELWAGLAAQQGARILSAPRSRRRSRSWSRSAMSAWLCQVRDGRSSTSCRSSRPER